MTFMAPENEQWIPFFNWALKGNDYEYEIWLAVFSIIVKK